MESSSYLSSISISLISQNSQQSLPNHKFIYDNIIKTIAELRIQVLSNYPEKMKFALLDPIEQYPEFIFTFQIDIQSQFLLVDLNCSHQIVKEGIAKIGTTKMLDFVNQANLIDNKGTKILWKSAQQCIAIRMNLFLFEEQKLPKNLCQIMGLLKNSMKSILKSFLLLVPKQTSIPFSSHYPVKDEKPSFKPNNMTKLQKIQNYLNKVISQRKQSKNILETMFPYSLPKQEQKIFDKSKVRKDPHIVRLIKVYEKQADENYEKKKGHNCQVICYRATYDILPCSSINRQTAKLMMEMQRRKNKQQNFIESKCINMKSQSIIAKKCLLQQDESFKNEIYTLNYLRNSACKNISSYFFQLNIHPLEGLQIYLEKHPKTLKENLHSSLKNKFAILKGILNGIIFLISNFVIHRDLKPANILLTKNLIPKIIDFGSARLYNRLINPLQLRTTRFYNIFYQQLNNQIKQTITKGQFESHILFDMYSIGRIIEQMLTDFQTKMTQGKSFIRDCQFIIRRCCEHHPLMRPSPAQVLQYLTELETSISKK